MRDSGGTSYSENDAVSFLGVCMDPKLQWGAHVNKVTKKLSSDLFLLRNLANNVSQKVLRTTYFALFHSHMSYALLVWGHSAEAHRVFGLQRKAVRLLAGLGFRDDCRDVFRQLQIMTFPSLCIFENLLHIKKYEDSYETHNETHSHNTRNKNKIVPIYWRLRRCQDGPGYWSIKLFNILPESVRTMPIRDFRNNIRHMLINNAFYSTPEYLNYKF